MALLGIYVGVIPIALGMLWLPWIRRIPPAWLRAVMALTVGLLGFLAIDATLEGVELAGEGSQAFGGVCARLPRRGRRLPRADRRRLMAQRSAGGRAPPRARAEPTLATLIAVGIGLHNLGEGLAIGTSYATGALALGAFLVVGFAIHNTTEGLAIVAPIAASRPSLARLALLGTDRRRARGARRVDRRLGVQQLGRRVPLRRRGRRDRPGHRPARAVAARRGRARPASARRWPACSAAWRSCSRPACSSACRNPSWPPRTEPVRATRSRTTRSRSTRCSSEPMAKRSRTNALAERCGVTPASASAMVKKLAERGLAIHEPYHGVRLTPDGERLALEMLRHHRLLELYLAEHLDVPWDRVHEEAEALEHVLSEDLEARIAAKLGHPTHDPARRPDPRSRPRHRRGAHGRPGQAAGRRGRALRAGLGLRSRDAALPRRARNRDRRPLQRAWRASRSTGRSRSASGLPSTSSAARWPARCASSWTPRRRVGAPGGRASYCRRAGRSALAPAQSAGHRLAAVRLREHDLLVRRRHPLLQRLDHRGARTAGHLCRVDGGRRLARPDRDAAAARRDRRPQRAPQADPDRLHAGLHRRHRAARSRPVDPPRARRRRAGDLRVQHRRLAVSPAAQHDRARTQPSARLGNRRRRRLRRQPDGARADRLHRDRRPCAASVPARGGAVPALRAAVVPPRIRTRQARRASSRRPVRAARGDRPPRTPRATRAVASGTFLLRRRDRDRAAVHDRLRTAHRRLRRRRDQPAARRGDGRRDRRRDRRGHAGRALRTPAGRARDAGDDDRRARRRRRHRDRARCSGCWGR